MIFSAGLICCGLAAFLYQFAELNQFEQAKKDIGRQTSIAQVAEAIEHDASFKDINLGIPEQPWFVNYDLMPDYAETQKTKAFFESLHKAGNVGAHSTFQNNMGKLHSYQILANMLLRKDEAHYFNTVSITPNMLTRKQLSSCYRLSQKMLHDLKIMSRKCKCSHEQHTVINLAVGRLTYLSRLIYQELSEASYIGQNEDMQAPALETNQEGTFDLEFENEINQIDLAPM